jgi:uncharacterized protein (TIGR02646 family)
MRKIHRRDLSPRTASFLARRRAKVHEATDRSTEVNRLWRLRNNRAFHEIRTVLEAMASGRQRCMYCEDNEGTDIDHFKPKSAYPLDAFTWSNFFLGCSRCNSNYKRTLFPVDASSCALLVDPSVDDPLAHLDLSLSTGLFIAKTAKGSASINVFGLNRATLQEGRRDAWITLCTLLPAYAAAQASGQIAKSDALKTAIRRFPFSAVLTYLLMILVLPGSPETVPDDVRDAINRHREIATWPSP